MKSNVVLARFCLLMLGATSFHVRGAETLTFDLPGPVKLEMVDGINMTTRDSMKIVGFASEVMEFERDSLCPNQSCICRFWWEKEVPSSVYGTQPPQFSAGSYQLGRSDGSQVVIFMSSSSSDKQFTLKCNIKMWTEISGHKVWYAGERVMSQNILDELKKPNSALVEAIKGLANQAIQ